MSSAISASTLTPNATSGTGKTTSKNALSSDDFIKLLITQLQSQDPTKPMSNTELLQQVTQIGTLQSQQGLETSLTKNQNELIKALDENNSTLSNSLTGLVLQNQIGASSNMIGKKVTGLADDGKTELTGVVTSIRVEKGVVRLELDTGKTMQMGAVKSISNQA